MFALKRLLKPARPLVSVSVIAAALAVSACQPPDSRFLTAGIGAQLSAPNTAQTERSQWNYFNFLCRQSGLASFADGANCISGVSGAPQWTQLTYQGMNDIDRRCDGYLEWLDNKKRSRAPVLAQLGSVRNAATQIIEITGSTASALKAITIVSQAFDLITQSIENYHSRLLLEIDQRTINTIVLQARHKFREDFRGQKVRNKPQAEYVLRSYLRICLPFAIESVINGNATLVALGASPDLAKEASIHQSPVLEPAVRPVVASPPRATSRTNIRPSRPSVAATPAVIARIKSGVQRALCVDDDGQKGPRSTEAIKIYQYVKQQPATGELSEAEEGILINDVGDCNSQFRNFLERAEFSNDPTNVAALQQLRQDVETLAQKHGADVTVSSEDTLSTLRPKIRAIKEKIGAPVLKSGNLTHLNSEFTPDLQRMLLE